MTLKKRRNRKNQKKSHGTALFNDLRRERVQKAKQQPPSPPSAQPKPSAQPNPADPLARFTPAQREMILTAKQKDAHRWGLI